MQQWEYLQLNVGGGVYADSQDRTGKVEKDSWGYKVGPLFNQLGTEGWELVGFEQGGYFFKRPKQ